MATLLKVLNNLADIKSAGGVALRVRTQAAHVLDADSGACDSPQVVSAAPDHVRPKH
jgi:hypothetical protein